VRNNISYHQTPRDSISALPRVNITMGAAQGGLHSFFLLAEEFLRQSSARTLPVGVCFLTVRERIFILLAKRSEGDDLNAGAKQ
jgi:hypothetical protein